MDGTTQNSILNFTSNVSGYTITLEKDEQKVSCNESDDNENNSICNIISNLSIGNYSLLVVNSSTNETIINIPNVINIYQIENVNFMNNSCINRKSSKFENFARVFFDHKIKYSDIEKAYINDSNNITYNLTKNSINKLENGTYIIGFSLLENISTFTEGNFSFSFKNSKNYTTNFKFSLKDTENISESINFSSTSSYKVVINGTQNSKNGTISLIFNGTKFNYSISNLRAASFEDVIFTKKEEEEEKDGKYYIPYLVETDQTGYSQLKFEICGATFNTKPIKFIQNVTEENNFNLKFNKILFLIFILLF